MGYAERVPLPALCKLRDPMRSLHDVLYVTIATLSIILFT